MGVGVLSCRLPCSCSARTVFCSNSWSRPRWRTPLRPSSTRTRLNVSHSVSLAKGLQWAPSVTKIKEGEVEREVKILTSAKVSIPQEQGVGEYCQHPAHRDRVQQTYPEQQSSVEPAHRQGKASQGNFMYIALFIHKADSKCFTSKHCHTIK